MAQTEQIDSLRNLANQSSGTTKIDVQLDMARKLLFISRPEAGELLDEVIEACKRIDYQSGLALAKVIQANLFMFQSQFENAEVVYKEAIQLAESTGNEEALAYGKLGLGALYLNMGQYALAYENHLEGLESVRGLDDVDLEMTYLMNIGIINQLLEDYDEAEKYLIMAKDLGEKQQLSQRLGQVFGNLGVVELKRNNFGRSIQYYEQAIEYFEKIGAKTQAAVCYQNMGYSYAQLNSNEEAEIAYDKSIGLRLETGDSLGYARGLRYKGELFLELGQLLQAKSLLLQSLSISRSFENDVLLSETYELLFKTHEKSGNFEEALAAHKSFIVLRDTLAQRANRTKIAELTADFELENLQNEIDLKAQANEIKDLKIKQKNLLILGIAALLLIAVFWGLHRRRQLSNQLKLKEKDSVIAQKEIELRAKEFEADKLRLIQYADQLLSKNEELEGIRLELETELSRSTEERAEIDELIQQLRLTINEEKDWAAFRLYFDSLFPEFFEKIKVQFALELTMYEQRLLALIRISLSNKEIGGILNISRTSVVRAKHRLRKKFDFEATSDLEEYISNL